jgi:hypothetical protein
MRLSLDALRMPLVALTENKLNDLLKSMKTKIKAQVKSRWYYIFWGTATVSVVLGQLYVGTGYRILHDDIQQLLRNVDGVLLHKEDSPYPYNNVL